MSARTRTPLLAGSTTTIKVGDSTWFVPAGFGRAYQDAGRDPAEPAVLRDLLELVGWTAPPEAIATWSLRRRVEAEVYAVRVHLSAGDNPVRVPPRPSWFPDPWKGEGSTVFEKAPTPLEVRS